jgi:nitrate reductase (NAD(P)H)
VERPHEFSTEELSGLPTFEIPVTVVCDGNRRKELNTITRSKGFDWGAGAVGTAMWRGVSLASVIRSCGVKPGAKFVCFEGADQLNNGNYGKLLNPAALVRARCHA